LRNWASTRIEGETPQLAAASGARGQLKPPLSPFTLQQPPRLCLLLPVTLRALCLPQRWDGMEGTEGMPNQKTQQCH